MAPTRAKQAKVRNWRREETLALISVWGDRSFQRMFESMVHNHTVWEGIYSEVLLQCPSIEDFGTWVRCKERLEYLKKKYRDCVKNNRRTGAAAVKCPYFEELDAVLGCRPITNPGDDHDDNRTTEEEDFEADAPNSQDNTLEQTTDPNDGSGTSSAAATDPSPQPINNTRKRKGKKTQVMEAVEKGLDRILSHDSSADSDHLRLEKERLEWEKEVERNRMDMERRRLEFDMRRLEADERRAREMREFMMQMMQYRPMPVSQGAQLYGPPFPSYLEHLQGPSSLRDPSFPH